MRLHQINCGSIKLKQQSQVHGPTTAEDYSQATVAASASATESLTFEQRETQYSELDSVTSSVLGTILRRAHTAEDIYRSGYNFCIRRLNKFACVCDLIRPNIIFQFVTAAQYNITCATLSAACARLSLIRSGRTHSVTVELTLPA